MGEKRHVRYNMRYNRNNTTRVQMYLLMHFRNNIRESRQENTLEGTVRLFFKCSFNPHETDFYSWIDTIWGKQASNRVLNYICKLFYLNIFSSWLLAVNNATDFYPWIRNLGGTCKGELVKRGPSSAHPRSILSMDTPHICPSSIL